MPLKVHVTDDHLRDLLSRLAEAEETLRAIRNGEVDALVVNAPSGEQVYTLKGAEHAYRILVEEMEEGAATLTAEGIILFCNRRFAEILRMPHERVVSASIADFLIPESQPLFASLAAEGLRGSARGEVELLAIDGTTVPVSVALGNLPKNDLSALCMVATDLTAQKKASAAIQRLNDELEERVRERTAQLEDTIRELDAFTSMVSHDLRGPLQVILGYTRILENTCATLIPPDANQHLGRISRSVKRMNALIDGLLAFSHSGRSPVAKQQVDLRELFQQALDEVRAIESERRVEVIVQDLPACEADPVLLRQVFVNLLSNAFKFTRNCDEARIEAGSYLEAEACVYFIRDNGIGFNPKVSAKLFDAFQRLHKQEEYEGSGIGLSTVKRIIQRHGGAVWAEGAAGAGATFYFTLGSETER